MSDNISTLASDTTDKEIEKKFSRMTQIQAELKEKYDYKMIKILGVMVQQFIKEHPELELPYNAPEIIEHCTKLREEYDKLRVEVAPYYPYLQQE